MTSESKQWDSLKTEYLRKVAKALSSANHPRRKDILEDVRTHLDQRFAELEPDQQTWENFQKIFTDMGPASDYADLLQTGQRPARQNITSKYLLWVVLALIGITAVMIILPKFFSDKQKAYELEKDRSVEPIDHPFANDPEIIGFWKSVDFVQTIDDFEPAIKKWNGNLFLKEVRFMEEGRTSSFFTWTKDWIWHSDGKTKAQYKIKKFAGEKYLFLPWLSGDVTIRGQKPLYYVLKKVSDKDISIEKPDHDKTKQAIKAAIDSAYIWLEFVDDAAYDQSWEQAAAYFKNAVTKEQLIQSFDAVRRPLGKVISRRIKSKIYTKQAPGAPDGQYVIIQFETSFENKKSAIETVTPMLDKDDSWRVSGYYIK